MPVVRRRQGAETAFVVRDPGSSDHAELQWPLGRRRRLLRRQLRLRPLAPVHAPGLRLALAGVGGYALGTIPSARVAARLVAGGSVDVAAAGTGNPGALNAARLLGPVPGVAVAVADVAKGVSAALVGRALAAEDGAHVAAVAAVAGHCFPPRPGCRGGKGVATSFGQCLATFPAYAPLDAAIALAASRLGTGRPALVAVAVSTTCWVASGLVWWRKGWPNLWGPAPSAALPLANAATALVMSARAVPMLRGREPDELALPRVAR